jgi:pimeloyl-ACP methyl ester carboxylesterase
MTIAFDAVPVRTEFAAPLETRRMRIGALQLNVALAGDGPTVLLLHGFPDSLQLWRAVAPRLLAAGCRVIAVDQRGFGDSDAPVGRAHYGIDVLVEDLATLLRATGTHEPVHVMGHDLGAVVTWRLAMARPELLRSAVAISVGHPREYALAGLEQKRKGLYTIGWQFPGIAEKWLQAHDWTRLRHWLRQHPMPEECLRDLARPGRLTAGLNWYRANLLPTVVRAWPACGVPMLGIWSSNDHYLAEDQMSRSARRMAAAWRYERIDGAGHWLPLERPDEIARLALDWFREHPGTNRPSGR